MTYTPLPATLVDTLRKRGLKVVEIPGWETRGRGPEHGEFTPIGVLWHHTGDNDDGKAYAEWLATKGRSDLPPPLCQLSVDREGTVYVCAAGRANHAGEAKPSGTVAGGDGNKLYVGVECQNTGTEGFADPQYAAMVLLGATLAVDVLHCSAQAERAHKETSVTGKWDPGKVDMDDFRGDLATKIAALKADDDQGAKKGHVVRARMLLEQALDKAIAKGARKRAAEIRAGLDKLPRS